jgi:hypothetical protein
MVIGAQDRSTGGGEPRGHPLTDQAEPCGLDEPTVCQLTGRELIAARQAVHEQVRLAAQGDFRATLRYSAEHREASRSALRKSSAG